MTRVTSSPRPSSWFPDEVATQPNSAMGRSRHAARPSHHRLTNLDARQDGLQRTPRRNVLQRAHSKSRGIALPSVAASGRKTLTRGLAHRARWRRCAKICFPFLSSARRGAAWRGFLTLTVSCILGLAWPGVVRLRFLRGSGAMIDTARVAAGLDTILWHVHDAIPVLAGTRWHAAFEEWRGAGPGVSLLWCGGLESLLSSEERDDGSCADGRRTWS